jgi:hypothetical protein
VETISAAKVGPKTLFASMLSSKAGLQAEAPGMELSALDDFAEEADSVLQPFLSKLCFND